MISEEDIVFDNMYASIHLDSWLGDIYDNEVKRKDVINYMMEDFELDKSNAEKLLETYYLSNLDVEPKWK
tara:strand:+ start:356 stop:565 length:210 start_codon:yes stop_codon:yes gene_type:complete